MPDIIDPKIFGWFGTENRDGLSYLIATYKIRTVIEIGTFLGLSTKFFAEQVEHVTCIDPFVETATEENSNNLVGTLQMLDLPNDFWTVFRNNMNEAGVWDKIACVRSTSTQASGVVDSADLVYVDGDHSYEGCKSDIQLYLPKAKKVIAGDDYTNYFPGVIKAVHECFPGTHKNIGRFWWHVV